jgi:hypothetical protein
LEATLNFRSSFPVVSLAVAAFCFASTCPAFANSTVDINWNCTTSPGAVANGSGCTNPSSPTSNLNSWAQGGFNVTLNKFLWNPNQGETGQGTGITGPAGEGYFSITGGAGASQGATGTITVTDGGSLFNFDSIDLKATAAGTYEIQYYGSNGQLISADTQSGSISSANKYVTIDGEMVNVSKIVITLDDTGVDYADFLDVNTPEPGTLLLLGSGMLALAFLVRRKPAA